MRIVIPMSGIGRRFVEAGYTDPKPLIEVEGRPIIHHVIDLFPGEIQFDFICNDEHLATTNMREVLLAKVPNAIIHGLKKLCSISIWVSKKFTEIPRSRKLLLAFKP